MGPDTVIRRKDNHVTTELDDELILMQVGSGQFYSMDDTARDIWQRLAGPITFEQLIEQLLEHYDLDRQTCVKEVSEFLRVLENSDLIQIAPV